MKNSIALTPPPPCGLPARARKKPSICGRNMFLKRAGDILELFATQGLRKGAVHRTRLRVGEGLVGDIAARTRPLALADAQQHPLFAYRPETGEEAYKSLMGVPILRGGRGLGVLVVQNRTSRQYSEEEVEALETVAMVLAELLAGGELVPPTEILTGGGTGLMPERLEGLALAPGLARGEVRLHQPRVTVDHMVADDPAAERERLSRALEATQVRLHGALERLSIGDQSHDIIETFSMFMRDRGWLRRIDEAIQTGLTAEAAVQRVQDDTRAPHGPTIRSVFARAFTGPRRSRQPFPAGTDRKIRRGNRHRNRHRPCRTHDGARRVALTTSVNISPRSSSRKARPPRT